MMIHGDYAGFRIPIGASKLQTLIPNPNPQTVKPNPRAAFTGPLEGRGLRRVKGLELSGASERV